MHCIESNQFNVLNDPAVCGQRKWSHMEVNLASPVTNKGQKKMCWWNYLN